MFLTAAFFRSVSTKIPTSEKNKLINVLLQVSRKNVDRDDEKSVNNQKINVWVHFIFQRLKTN